MARVVTAEDRLVQAAVLRFQPGLFAEILPLRIILMKRRSIRLQTIYFAQVIGPYSHYSHREITLRPDPEAESGECEQARRSSRRSTDSKV